MTDPRALTWSCNSSRLTSEAGRQVSFQLELQLLQRLPMCMTMHFKRGNDAIHFHLHHSFIVLSPCYSLVDCADHDLPFRLIHFFSSLLRSLLAFITESSMFFPRHIPVCNDEASFWLRGYVRSSECRIEEEMCLL
jgi:hypothetical protein